MRMEAVFDVDAEPAISCNCSICRRTGALLRFVTEDQTKILAGGSPTDYQFNTKTIHHLFCSSCGTRPWGRGQGPDGSSMVAINLRCISGLDLDTIKVHAYDGQSL